MLIKAAFCQELIEKELQPLKDIPFSFFWDNRPSLEDLKINKINIYGHSEPNEYFGNHSWINENAHYFNYILTWNEDILQKRSNAIFCPFGTSPFYNISLSDPVLTTKKVIKRDKVSFIRGNKHFNVSGHHLRWELWHRKNEIYNIRTDFYDVTNPPYASNPEEEIRWFEQRRYIFEDPMFHVAIENTSHPGYFTEKIMDCFLFRTIPIYYGCPSINNFFNSEGIITFNTVDELVEICNNLTEEDYNSRRLAIFDNQIRCLEYLNLGKTIFNILQSLLENI